jgi:tetratricopeptide (TPR) repeat protein
MKTRFLAMAILLAGGFAARAQLTHDDIRRDLSNADELIGQGKYPETIKLLKEAIDRFDKARQGGATAAYFAYLGALGADAGQFKDADQLLKSAENYSTKAEDEWDAVVSREQAALHLERGEYDAALKSAKRAYDCFGSSGDSFTYLRAAYCQSLAAEAQLGLGKTDQAETLARDALKVVPKKETEKSFIAPRILYAACRVETRRANFAEAEQLCLGGVAMAGNAGAGSRNVALGYLALAELYLQQGDLAKAAESGKKCLAQTEQTFGSQHQDAMQALEVLARVNMKQGNPEEAELHAKLAVEVAKALFGDSGAPAKAARQTLNEVTKAAK